MKKLVITAFSCLCFNSAQAGDTDIWQHIGMLQDQMVVVSNQIAALAKQISSIPAGPQGPQGMPGPKGERGPEGHYQAGSGIRIEGDVISANTISHQIGERYQGGIVFWVDDTGQHGLIASVNDVKAQGIQWRNGESGSKVTNARADGIGAGESNTRLIIAQQTIDNQTGEFAALLAHQYSVAEDGETPCITPANSQNVCYGGWYLPSIYELSLLKANLQPQGLTNFAPDYYWSSTESSVSKAWLQNFSTGEVIASDKANTLGHVRAVRQF
ncbi:DUF1566 domain-containing protein [Legionella sp. 16cNR16C]|uniref:Lcl domain-containing protein n=1 Tax=Legionella sp. 16cNR16C TaxID=2905656 RepID=UPI001E39DB8F|nr:DUF1566 domain-containing protein [Legionella sp. 16cNR16C]MCE3045359.1 DUF1566 domain-containing protein [Legionella sp. 16cNR16C]